MDLNKELNLFSDFSGQESSYCKISSQGPSILFVESKSSKKKNIKLGFMALIHGNEYLGLPILNSLLNSILNGEIQIHSDIYFGLGNIPAAHANKRYIEEDLNRAFGKMNSDTVESKRARELETHMLRHCDFLIDIHQTVTPAHDPFFIFQYTNERCLAVMKKWNPGIPTILQLDQLGSNTGLCADEYVRSCGKFAAALELGQLGTTEYFDLGLRICKNAIQVTDESLLKSKVLTGKLEFPLLRLNGSYKVKDSSYKLDAGWKNLMPFKKGEKLGTFDEGVVIAPTSGLMLFPRYRVLNSGEELFYYCTAFEIEIITNIPATQSVELI